jgi:hypothetical protein
VPVDGSHGPGSRAKARAKGSDGRAKGSDGAAAPPSPGRADDRRTENVRLAALDRLLTAASGLAQTIAATEELAQQRADILTRRSTVLGPSRDASYRQPIISLAEAARRTGRHPEVLRRWCLEGRIEGIRIGRTWGITPETLALLMAHSGRSRPRLSTSSSA